MRPGARARANTRLLLFFSPQALLPKPPPAASEPARTRAVLQLAEQGDGGDVKASAASCKQLLQLCCSSASYSVASYKSLAASC